MRKRVLILGVRGWVIGGNGNGLEGREGWVLDLGGCVIGGKGEWVRGE